MIRGSPSHLDLTVADLARSAGFYDPLLRHLGFRRDDALASGAPAWFLRDEAGGHFGIALVEAQAEREPHRRFPGLHHFAFHVDSRAEVDACHTLVVELGTTVLDAPNEYDYTPGYYAVFFSDPDGMKLEVVHEPALRGRT